MNHDEVLRSTIAATYIPEWGIAEGLREIVQNWIDAHTAADVPLGTPDMDDARDITLRNPGHIDRAALLVGSTTKVGSKSAIGHFGEGLKLGALALVRAGCAVVVRSASETWIACVEPSPEYGGASTLCWRVMREGHGDAGDAGVVSVRVSGLPSGAWAKEAAGFLALRPRPVIVQTEGHGSLLGGGAGDVYVRGVHVTSVPDLPWSVDLQNASTDRDRRMVADFDLAWSIGRLVNVGLQSGRIDAGMVLDELLRRPDGPCRYVDDFRSLVAAWRARWGEAMAVRTEQEVQLAAGIGRMVIVVLHENLRRRMQEETGRLEDAIQMRRRQPVCVVDESDLTEAERSAMSWCRGLLTRVCGMPDVAVVEYVDPACMGRYIVDTGQVEVARRVLGDRAECLITLIHEVAHRAGPDFSSAHRAEYERLAAAAVRVLAVGGAA